MTPQPAGSTNRRGLRPDNRDNFVRLSVNLNEETAEELKSLIGRRGFSISEGVRRAIAVWKFLEDEKSRGNEIAVIEADGSARIVVLL
jgi:hypothetical protein